MEKCFLTTHTFPRTPFHMFRFAFVMLILSFIWSSGGFEDEARLSCWARHGSSCGRVPSIAPPLNLTFPCRSWELFALRIYPECLPSPLPWIWQSWDYIHGPASSTIVPPNASPENIRHMVISNHLLKSLSWPHLRQAMSELSGSALKPLIIYCR